MTRIRVKKALITGITGQDGYYLTRLLLEKGYQVYGIARDPLKIDISLVTDIEEIFQIDLLEPEGLIDVISSVAPDEIYHLAAHHFSSQTNQNRTGALDPFIRVNLIVVDQILQAISLKFPETRFFYPASSHIFGTTKEVPQSEATVLNPETSYAISKVAGLHLCRYYRNVHGIFSAVGILYNHESPRRGSSFITTKIARAAALASLGQAEQLMVHNMDAIVDWGAAQDYVRAMWLMLQRNTAEEYVVASGTGRTVRDFARQAFASVGISAEDLVLQDPVGGHAAKVPMVGDSTKLRRKAGWQVDISFEAMVAAMVTEQQRVLQQGSA